MSQGQIIPADPQSMTDTVFPSSESSLPLNCSHTDSLA